MRETSANYQSNLKNIRATFAIEGIDISDVSISNIEKLAEGKVSCDEIIRGIISKYKKKV